MLIHHFLENSAALFPDKVAIICNDARYSYDDVNSQSNSLAYWLRGQGLENGDRVALLLNNSTEYVISYFGILKAGAVAVPLNCEIKPDSLRQLLQKLNVTILITAARYERLLEIAGYDSLGLHTMLITGTSRSWGMVTCRVHSWHDIIQKNKCDNPLVAQEDTDLASIIFTSGSMGQPKGVMLSHGNIVANASSIIQILQLTSTDRQMVVLPFNYVMGKSLLTTHIAVGGSIVINNKFAFPATILKEMEEEEVTGFSGVPSTYAYLLHRSPLRQYRERLGALRYCSQAGGHLSWRLKLDLLEALPIHTQLYVMYGATEASARLSYVEPKRLREKPDSIGRAIPGVTLKIRDPKGCELPIGTTGELVAEGNNIMQGYWQESELTTAVLGPNGYHTGDLGYQDEDGYFYIVGRKDSQLKVGGHRVDPQEIEDILISTGLLLEVMVFGIPDTLLGNRLLALGVALQQTTTPQDILALCSIKLPRHKIPSELKIVPVLPKNSSGKLDAVKCREMYGFEE